MGLLWSLMRCSHRGERNHMKPLRLALLGFGTVGQWLVEVLHTQQAWLQREFGLDVTLISLATAHHGLIYRDDGLDIPTLLDLVATRQPLTAHPKVTRWTNVLEGLQATGGNVLAEATGATLRHPEPGLSYIRAALTQDMHVITSSKGPVGDARAQHHPRGDGRNQNPRSPRPPQRHGELHPQCYGAGSHLCRSTR